MSGKDLRCDGLHIEIEMLLDQGVYRNGIGICVDVVECLGRSRVLLRNPVLHLSSTVCRVACLLCRWNMAFHHYWSSES